MPFEAADALGWVYCHVARKPLPLESVRSSVPPVLSGIILKQLAKVPDERYQSASGLACDLERCLQHWTDTGQIAPFPLGERDVSHQFLIPQRPYGRAAECGAQAHGGDLHVDSEPGHGAIFTVTLPPAIPTATTGAT